jgi:hypothetical protein
VLHKYSIKVSSLLSFVTRYGLSLTGSADPALGKELADGKEFFVIARDGVDAGGVVGSSGISSPNRFREGMEGDDGFGRRVMHGRMAQGHGLGEWWFHG